MWKSFGLVLLLLIGLAGCAEPFAFDNDDDFLPEEGDTVNISNRNDLLNSNSSDDVKKNGANFGFVRHQKSPIEGDTVDYDTMYSLDREEIADSIGKMAITLPRVQDISTLVTDEEVLISYKTDATGEKERFEVADQVKKTALSIVPRWFHVYVTDDDMLRRNIENISQMNSTMSGVNEEIDDVVYMMMTSSPQGENVDYTENPNGEMMNEKNGMSEDDVHSLDHMKNDQHPERHDFTKEMAD
ncbi:hypothetical protein Q73_12150 [Bacillus coahuilensis m2-6]|uniref:Sporulation protein n=1 Tax=Bacillus coahuilensis p1.1.43 TaxID=1150625 RepID=A0A147K612_9BACI|nr:YhcN/YlaJ family sporulation lipoprotein [Bacillus coahuilensis]KUP05298.1 hypothetical protein Q75_12745 [Bacillus coahuilensis p1.1.43]KUP05940.1 hypothetical protein Q73_12150 [Bacillus coahuilensis m2-6]